MENLLIDNLGTLKIADFGMAVRKSELENWKPTKKGQGGTPAYMAPEIWENKERITEKVDIWAAGCVLYAMIYGSLPFKGYDKPDLAQGKTAKNMAAERKPD